MNYLNEYRRLGGMGVSLLEKEAGTDGAMLDALTSAFSTKVKPQDVKFIRYRKLGDSVEMEDQAARLGGILTSVEADDVDLGQLTSFLKKHGAKPLKKSTEEAAPLAGLLAMGDQEAAEDEINAAVIKAFKKALPAWTSYLEKLTGTTWRADVGELTVDFNEAFGKKRSIGVYWDVDVGNDQVTFYVEGPRGTGTQIFQRKTVITPSKPNAPKEFFGWLEKTLQEAVAWNVQTNT